MEELLNFPTNFVWFRNSGKEWNVLIKSTESSKINGLHKQSDNQFNLNDKRLTITKYQVQKYHWKNQPKQLLIIPTVIVF